MSGFTPEEIERRLQALTGWERRGDAIEKRFDCRNFDGSMEFITRIATVANAQDHHPDFCVSWNDVTLTLSSHDVVGVTERDFRLAGAIDELFGSGR